MRASSDGWSVTVRALVRSLLLTARRYGTPPVGIHVDISYSIRHLAPLYGQRSQPDAIIRRCADDYVTPDEAAMERAYTLTARQWQAWMGEAYRPSYNVAPCG